MIRRVVFWCVVIILVLWVSSDPHGAAGLADGVVHGFQHAASGFGAFLSGLGVH